MAVAWIFKYGCWNYVYYLEFMKNDFEIVIIGRLMIIVCITKRAKIPFSSWLPAAIAAPTPVSTLVHSSTLVTAGIYLMIWFNLFLVNTYIHLLHLLAGLTIFMSRLGANFEFDLNKIIALSTLRQLGLMMIILSIGYKNLVTHALYKALLFIYAGAIIHNITNSQGLRLIGGLSLYMALCGIPFLTGFYSKDLILTIVSLGIINIFNFLLISFSTGLTVCYSLRLVCYSLTGDLNCRAFNVLNDEGLVILKGIFGLIIIRVMTVEY